MLFNSFNFIFVFLPIVLVVSRSLRGQALLKWITFASFVFYAFAGHVWFLIPMGFTTVVDYKMAQFIEESTSRSIRKRWLIVSLCGNLGLLAYFKYLKLILKTAEGFFPHFTIPASSIWFSIFYVTLPAGISFYTFQTLSYIIDIYRGNCKAERNFFRFASFVSFFPHLVAGPLTRHDQLIPGLTKIASAGIKSRWGAGLFLFAIGICKKVLVADRIGNAIDPILSHPGTMGAISSWSALLGYAIQIYFDFSGYSDMAIGLGRLLGIELPENFRRPYTSRDPSEFWTRWHITLSQWLRDYLYITLGGNKCSELRRNFNLMMTMFLGGLWHGASWAFAVWGVYHGLLLIIYHESRSIWDKWSVATKRFVTFVLVCFGWVFFRANTFSEALNWFYGLFGGRGIGLWGTSEIGVLLLVFVAMMAEYFIPVETQKSDYGLESLRPVAQGILGALCAGALLLMNYSSKFLYFQF